MTPFEIAFLLALFALGVLLNAFFAGYETGFVSSNPIRIRHMAEVEGDKRAKKLLRYIEQPDRMITLVLVGTNLALIFGTIALTRAVDPTWSAIIATPAFLIFGEVMPKSMFRLHPNRFAVACMPLIRFFDSLLAPLVAPVTLLSSWMLPTKEDSSDTRLMVATPDDIRVLVDESADHGAIEPEEQEMIHSIIDLTKQSAKEVFVPRIDIVAVSDTATKSELVAVFKESGHTRIPVYRETVDQIIGVVNAFDLLRDTEPDKNDITRFVRDIMHVPDSMKLDDVLRAMRNERQSLAVVTDEYGGTDGLLSIEDVLEEVFGEIHDEFDKAETPIRKVGPSAFVVDARTPLPELTAAIDMTIDDEEVETVGGWLMHAVGRIPQKGEVIELELFRITVLEGGPNHVSSVRLEVRPPPEA